MREISPEVEKWDIDNLLTDAEQIVILILSASTSSRMDRVKNEEVRRRAGIERELASRADQRVLRWFGHVERMDDYRIARRVLMDEVSGGRVRGRPRLG